MILYIGNALASHGVAPTAADVLPGLLREEGLRVVVASSQRSPVLRLVHMLGSILFRAASTRYVVIDVYSTLNFWYAVLSAMLCRSIGLRYIPVMHGGDLPGRMDRSPGAVRALLNNAHCVVVPSAYLREELSRRGYSCRLIPNAIPIASYPYLHRAAVGPRLLYVRALSRLYNPQMALKVLSKLRARYPEAQLCMVGADKDGSLQDCKALASTLGIQSAVTFTGLLEKTAWHRLSSSFDIFVNTTTKDNMPVSVVEAMALGLPVVSTNPGGIPYLIDDGKDGLLVPVGDVDAMVEKIVALIESPGLAGALSASARSRAELFDWSSVKFQWLDVLSSGTRGA